MTGDGDTDWGEPEWEESVEGGPEWEESVEDEHGICDLCGASGPVTDVYDLLYCANCMESQLG